MIITMVSVAMIARRRRGLAMSVLSQPRKLYVHVVTINTKTSTNGKRRSKRKPRASARPIVRPVSAGTVKIMPGVNSETA